MAYENLSDEELIAYWKSNAKGNQMWVMLGVLTLVIGIGVLFIIKGYIGSMRAIKARREVKRRGLI